MSLDSKIQTLKDKFQVTYKQAHFVLVFDGNASKAARIAGYKHPKVSGHRNLTNDNVRAALDHVRARETAPIMQVTELLETWSELARDPLADPKDRLKAMDSLARAHALYTDKTVNLSYTKTERVDQLSDSELDRLLISTVQKIMASNPQLISFVSSDDQGSQVDG